jgi:hypothetical protein
MLTCPDCLPSPYCGARCRFVVFLLKRLMAASPDGLQGFSPETGYSKGSISFWKISFFRVPSILWAMLPCLSIITVVGTTAMLP